MLLPGPVHLIATREPAGAFGGASRLAGESAPDALAPYEIAATTVRCDRALPIFITPI
jgi:hypothetical protein